MTVLFNGILVFQFGNAMPINYRHFPKFFIRLIALTQRAALRQRAGRP